MDKKKFVKTQSEDDLKGFEEFIEGIPQDPSFLSKPGVSGTKKETSFEHFTHLATDGERLLKLKNLLSHKLSFMSRFEQGNSLLKQQKEEMELLKLKLFEQCDKPDSAYRKSIKEIFDSYFSPN